MVVVDRDSRRIGHPVRLQLCVKPGMIRHDLIHGCMIVPSSGSDVHRTHSADYMTPSSETENDSDRGSGERDLVLDEPE